MNFMEFSSEGNQKEPPPSYMAKKAIIIGAGVSGLAVGSLLQDKGFHVTILEAKDRIGGRIQENMTFADFPIEIGGEEVHGEDSYHYKIAKEVGAEFVDESGLSFFVEYGSQLCPERTLITKEKAFERVLGLNYEELVALDDNRQDCPLSEYIRETGLPDGIHHTVDGIFGCEWSTDVEKLGIKALKRWNVLDVGSKNFLLKTMSNYQIITKKFANVLDKVILNTPVASIHYGLPNGVEVTDKTGKTFTADLVIVSVPISQLKQNKIQFKPDLPSRKKEALEKVAMDSVMKIFVRFKRRFWDESLGNLITQGVVKLMWPSSTGGKSEKCHVLTGLISGKNAVRLSNLSKKELEQLVLDDLKRVYGDSIQDDFEEFMVQDWTKEEYIEGGYTFPNINEDEDTRKILAESIMDKVYFVGEGMNNKFALISGAIESSHKAFKEICATFLGEGNINLLRLSKL